MTPTQLELVGTGSGDSPSSRLDSTVISKPKTRYRKIIFSGALLEEYLYEVPLRVGFSTHGGRRKKREKTERTMEYKKRTARLAQTKIRRLAALNFIHGAKFVTLTFSDNNEFDISDPAVCYIYLLNFMRRLKRTVGLFHFICVPERQKRGAIHYHLIVDLPYIQKEKLATIWTHGFVDIRKIDDPVRRAAYLAKYLTKDGNEYELKGRRYYTSRNLKKPKILYGDYADQFVEIVKRGNRQYTFHSKYDSEHNGEVEFYEYNLADSAREDTS